tara:strand:- start:130 stop:501 length:372 start_codon:yes stop_codon:yes gene_type:complete
MEIDKRYVVCGFVNRCKKDERYVGYFRNKPLWLFFENEYYEKSMDMEFPNEFYKAKQCVPKYTISKNRKSIFPFFPRELKNGDKYLFGLWKNKRYYIWEVDNNYNIKKNAKITFDIKSDFYKI